MGLVFQYNKQSLNWCSHLKSTQLVSRRICCCRLLFFRVTAALWGFPVTSLSSVTHLISFPHAFCLSLVWHPVHFSAKILRIFSVFQNNSSTQFTIEVSLIYTSGNMSWLFCLANIICVCLFITPYTDRLLRKPEGRFQSFLAIV